MMSKKEKKCVNYIQMPRDKRQIIRIPLARNTILKALSYIQ